jgi:ABC-type branched-subunit amino acid transport system ATPase component/ABC-type branched-subunit amino acid transport system permease subunit
VSVSETTIRRSGGVTLSRSGRVAAPVVLWIAALAVLPSLLGSYLVGVGATVGINTLLAIGLILVCGYAGQFSLSTAAWYGIGAYGTALLTVKAGWPALLALVVSAAVAAAFAYALGPPIFRLRGHFLAMGTLALTTIFYLVANNIQIAGGATGFGGILPFSIFGFEFAELTSQFWLIWLVVGAVLWGALRMGRSREGRALRAIRGHEAAAAACGINPTWAKTRVFAGSAVIGSIAGSLYAHQLLYVNPPPFDALTSINVLVIAVLGGLHSPWGAVIGAVAIEAIRQAIEGYLPSILGPAAVGAGEALALGVILVIILVVRPDGIVGLAQVLRTRAAGVLGRNGAKQSTDDTRTVSADAGIGGKVAATTADLSAPLPPVGTTVKLKAEGLSKVFGGVRAVDGVDLVLHDQEILAVIGPNGAGKSTLLNLLSGNLPPTAGVVSLNGHDVTKQPAYAVAGNGLARTFQTPSLFPGVDVRTNVLVGAHLRGRVGLLRSAIPTPGAVRQERRLADEVDGLLSELGLGHLADTEVTELSLGQQKMIEVARALAQRPSVLLLDEPGAGLTRPEKLELAATLRSLRAEGMALLLIEHDMEFVMSLADRVQVLNFGRTLAVGTPDEVQANPEVVNAYLGVDQGVKEAVSENA